MAAPSASLKEYLKKYQSATEDQSTKKKKKRKKEKYHPKPTATGVLVVDEDPVWQKPILEDAEEEESGEELPQIDEDVEVKRMKRLEAIRSRKPYHMISNDGSGWVSVSDQAKNLNHANLDTDLSPPRQQRLRFDTPSPGRERSADGARNDDLSPPRQRRRRFDTPSPDRGQKVEDSRSSKLSPPRQRRRRFDTPCTDSPERKVGEDLSPPRKRSTEDSSPPRRNRNRSPEADLSPPRRNRNRSPGADLSPPRRRGKSSEVDLSPPRRNRNRLFEADLSPLRKGTLSADLSPPRRRKEVSLAKEGDLSPPRRRRELSLAKEEDLPPPRRDREPSLTKEVRRTGLLSAEEIRNENEKKRKEEIARFASMDPSVSGRGAQPIFRDKEGKRIKKEDLLKAQEAEEEKSKEKKLEWGKGLAQKREAEARAQELELEKDKPFARSRDDPELDKMLKERVRWGDPMAHLVKKNSETLLEDLGHDEKMKESGFIIPQTIPSHSWVKRGIDFPPNRYGIRPGRHWDGVDRSNGYEKELFKRQNEKRATEAEAYLWSVSDM